MRIDSTSILEELKLLRLMMIVVSLFDGIGTGYDALLDAGIPISKYYSSEIDKYASAIAQYNHPDLIELGDVRSISKANIDDDVDILMGGFPCQAFSLAGRQKGFDDDRGLLFYEVIRLIEELKPRYFLFENVRMKKEYLNKISSSLEVEPILLNSALVSAQNRLRYYWLGIRQSDGFYKAPIILQPEDKGIVLKDILMCSCVDRNKSYCLDSNYHKGTTLEQYQTKKRRQIVYCNEDSTFTTGELKEYYPEKDKESLCKCVGSSGENSYESDNRVYSGEGKSPTLRAKTTNKYLKVLCNQVGIADLKGQDCIKRVYSANGKSPTLTTMGGGHREPKIVCNKGTIVGRRINENGHREDYNKTIPLTQCLEVRKSNSDKSACLTGVEKDVVISSLPIGRYPNAYSEELKPKWRKLLPIECERLQTLDDDYTKYGVFNDGKLKEISKSRRYQVIGNGWTRAMITHLLSSFIIP